MNSKINRRKFIEQTSLGSAGVMLAPSFVSPGTLFNQAGAVKETVMGGITPVSVIDNACMLAFRSGDLSHLSQQVITSDIHMRNVPGDKGRLAVVFPPGSKKLIELLNTIKITPEVKYAKEKRVLAFGWAAVNAVDRYINRDLKNKTAEEAAEIRMHQDAILIREFSQPDFDVTKASENDMEKLLNAMLVRTATRIHTFKPDSDDGIGWVNRITDWRKQNAEKMKSFSRILISPDVNKAGKSFFNRNDELVSSANKLQKAQNVGSGKIRICLQGKVLGHYAKALAEATNNILAIDSFLENKMSEEKLMQLLKLG